MHRKFLIFGRICCVFGVLSILVLLVDSILDYSLPYPAPIAYFMLFSVMLMVLCLLIGFVLDLMSHLIRKDMSAIVWLFVFTIAFYVFHIFCVVGELDYTTILYNSFLMAAGLRGFWYIIGIRQYEIKL